MFQKYKNVNGDSNVDSFEITPTSITIFFKGTKRPYTYSYEKAGKIHVENMIRLAESGKGLNSYINLNCKKMYD